ncbi:MULTISPECIES: hypothetical protein [Pseudoalteromonas]|uniref:Uncharacterized protein n=1 Tax=Pseudoalteromonas luteoviolacea (strain 2ta16) TaxID=1353533 RepID=V4H1F8_PSEL2|nr:MULTISPECIES: hypothetical protein [Pseudoalteromonas]ESP91281.1 hypothetical protein PL2TA16_00966 [Pseudoalteromonas luteoviolacea 2ta16]KZN34784.1 hypothetical protein N483_24500 [Pseudoalteromonas luteoviolacea NCIMB 1944]MCG7551428.1 hypothetical protein [Pseudoalteromonas sp. Of7M-16]
MKLKIQKKKLKSLSSDKGIMNEQTPQVAGGGVSQEGYGCNVTNSCATNLSLCCHASKEASCIGGFSCRC